MLKDYIKAEIINEVEKNAMTRAPPTDGESHSHPLLNNANAFTRM